MATLKLTFDANQATAELIAAIITETFDGNAVSLTEAGACWHVEAYLSDATDLDALNGLLAQALGEVAHPVGRIERLPDQDWVAIVQSGLQPVRAGGFFIHGSHDRHKARFERHAIEIDAGRAFGTAHHGTTQGCLTAIGMLAACQPVRTVLDVGTGSGILAIAAAKACRADVIATDIDPVAVSVARENVLKNGAQDRVRCLCGKDTAHRTIGTVPRFDLIVANILAEPLMALSRDLCALARPGGAIVLSGLLDEQAAAVFARYRSMGCRLQKRLSIEAWTTLILRRR